MSIAVIKTVPAYLLETMETQFETNVLDLSTQRPVLLVFLRHFGCIFCREAMSDLNKLKDKIAEKNFQLCFVHMATPETADAFFNEYKLTKYPNISDPECHFYRAFGLIKGKASQLLGLSVWVRGFEASILGGHGLTRGAKELGDEFQMPGIFTIYQGNILKSYIHKHASDRPNYLELLDVKV